MQCRGFVWPLVLAALLCCLVVACAPGGDTAGQAEREAEWALLEESQSQLQEQRAELRELRAKVAAGLEVIEVDEESGMSPEEALLDLEAAAATLEQDTNDLADEFVTRLVAFINEDPMVQGEEPTELQLAALRMKSGEDIELAWEYVDKGGDYKRALEIVERAQGIDPDNEALAEAIVAIADKRYVNEERFASVEKGMSQAAVEAILGRVFHRNVREYEEQGALAWFYPKDPEVGGGAVAVFFRKNKADAWVVYQMDFAIEPEE